MTEETEETITGIAYNYVVWLLHEFATVVMGLAGPIQAPGRNDVWVCF